MFSLKPPRHIPTLPKAVILKVGNDFHSSPNNKHGALHSITSSARASSEGGTARPSAFTVLRLITNSSTPNAERPSPPLLDQLGAKTSVLDVGY